MMQTIPTPTRPRVGSAPGRGSLGGRLARLARALVAGTALLAVAHPVAAAPVPHAVPDLLAVAQAQPDQTFRLIVARDPRSTADGFLLAKGYQKIKDVAGGAEVVEVKGKDVSDLAAQPGVRQVALDARMVVRAQTGHDQGPDHTGRVNSQRLATLYPESSQVTAEWSKKLTGFGVGVAVVDTGIADLPDFNGRGGTSRVVARVDLNSGSHALDDGYGHGTHVAGIIGGNSWESGNAATQGKYVGMAPETNLVDVRVADDQGATYESDVINGIEWAIAHREEYNLRVLNLSLESSVPESYTTSLLDAEVERAWFNGILVVVSAGNDGPSSMLYPPANDPFVVTVGAADANGTTSSADDFLAPWSSYGTTQDGFAKPDVVAVGRVIYSTLAPNSVLAQQFSDRIADSSYVWLSGTSMSAAVVSGAAAVIFQAHPDWSNDQVKGALGASARQLGTTDPSTGAFQPYPGQGAGEIDVSGAIQIANPSSANQGLTISPLLEGPNGATTYSVTGTSSTWKTSSWRSSSWANTFWESSTWRSSTWKSADWQSSTWKSTTWESSTWR